MARTRELVCIHYKAKGECDLGKKAEFYGLCQTCQKYFPKPGSHPVRKDRRKEIKEKINKKEFKNFDKYV